MLPPHLKKRKRKFVRDVVRGADRKAGTHDSLQAARREAIAAAEKAQAAANNAAESGADREEQAAAAAAARAAVRDAVRAKVAVKNRSQTSACRALPRQSRQPGVSATQ
mmetsp:Transcript_30302/g.65148  ORF Transcript_30302/g.65148 Transcript_30302/m.65148 type:complete len:109 (+) Transcript_30302:238-564(+)